MAHDKTFDRLEYQFNGKKLREECIFAVRFPMSLAYKFGFEENSFLLGLTKMWKNFFYMLDFMGSVRRNAKNLHLGHTKWLNVSYLPPYSIDLSENLKQLFLYCDIVEPQIVGSNLLKLMRVIPINPDKPAHYDQYQATWEAQRVEYLKLSKKHFDTIEIQVRNALGYLFPFLRGRTVVKLHFKKAYQTWKSGSSFVL